MYAAFFFSVISNSKDGSSQRSLGGSLAFRVCCLLLFLVMLLLFLVSILGQVKPLAILSIVFMILQLRLEPPRLGWRRDWVVIVGVDSAIGPDPDQVLEKDPHLLPVSLRSAAES